MRPYLLLTLAACAAFSACANAQDSGLKLPDFAHMHAHPTESVDITVGPVLLKLASWFADDRDQDSAAAAEALRGLRSLHVQHYEFSSDDAYSKADVDAVRSQLAAAGWNQVTRVHNGGKNEDVDVYLSLDKERITGVAIVASEPREFTIVHAVGSLDVRQVERLREKFKFDHHSAASDSSAPLL
jgi:hypothetical protein